MFMIVFIHQPCLLLDVPPTVIRVTFRRSFSETSINQMILGLLICKFSMPETFEPSLI